MFNKEKNDKEEKYRITAVVYVLAASENDALEIVKNWSIGDADEKRITKMRRN